MILDERGFDGFMQWAQRANDVLRPIGTPPLAFSDDEWRNWGAQLGLFPAIPAFPNPYHYEDWRNWVRDLNRCVELTQLIPWSAIPNLAKTGSFSVNVLTAYYVLPTTGVTLTLNGTLPTGWSFASPTLSHSGAVLAGPNPISFTASYANGVTYISNTFTVQGI